MVVVAAAAAVEEAEEEEEEDRFIRRRRQDWRHTHSHRGASSPWRNSAREAGEGGLPWRRRRYSLLLLTRNVCFVLSVSCCVALGCYGRRRTQLCRGETREYQTSPSSLWLSAVSVQRVCVCVMSIVIPADKEGPGVRQPPVGINCSW